MKNCKSMSGEIKREEFVSTTELDCRSVGGLISPPSKGIPGGNAGSIGTGSTFPVESEGDLVSDAEPSESGLLSWSTGTGGGRTAGGLVAGVKKRKGEGPSIAR